ncbi:MAG: hypothetical protein AB1Z57_03075 [Acidimicrobiia bacterium]
MTPILAFPVVSVVVVLAIVVAVGVGFAFAMTQVFGKGDEQ